MAAKNSEFRLLIFAMLIGGFACTLFSQSIAAQSQKEKKPKREKFGKSLDRLKWDSKKGAAVEKEKHSNEALPSDGEAIKLETLFVALEMAVTDPASSRFVTGLGKDDFIVIEDGQPQEIATITRGDDATLPRSIILIIDYSGSQSPYISASISAAKTLVNRLAPSDEMAIVTDRMEMLTDFTGDRQQLNSALDALDARAIAGSVRRSKSAGSLQFSALFAALREMVKSEGSRPIIIFQTDGDEAVTFRDQPSADDYRWNMPSRNYGLGDIYTAAERSRATIYTVVPNAPLVGLSQNELYSRGRQMLYRVERERFDTENDYLKHLETAPISDAYVKLLTKRFAQSQIAAAHVADLTGGWTAFLQRPEDASLIYDRILTDINHRYVIGYYPENANRDGGLRRVRVEVKGHPKYRVHGRSSYYAPGPR